MVAVESARQPPPNTLPKSDGFLRADNSTAILAKDEVASLRSTIASNELIANSTTRSNFAVKASSRDFKRMRLSTMGVSYSTTTPSTTNFPVGTMLNSSSPQSTRSTFSTTNSKSEDGLQLEIGLVASKLWEDIKKMMGFTPDCLNGGHKNLRGDCTCLKYYSGEFCEHIVCLNNGTMETGPSMIDSSVTVPYCKCPYPDFISGKHCELVRCHNGGRDLGNGHCACVDNWYTGRFCEYYTSSWLLAISLPMVAVFLLILCCVVCRLDFCPRKRSIRRSDQQLRQQYRAAAANLRSFQPPRPAADAGPNQNRCQQRQHLLNSNNSGCGTSEDRHRFVTSPAAFYSDQMLAARQQLIIQQNLLNESRMQNEASAAFPHGYVVRLEHLPIYSSFNENLPLSAEETGENTIKFEPPPSYDQAMLRCLSLNASGVLPPNYSPPRLQNEPQDDDVEESGD